MSSVAPPPRPLDSHCGESLGSARISDSGRNTPGMGEFCRSSPRPDPVDLIDPMDAHDDTLNDDLNPESSNNPHNDLHKDPLNDSRDTLDTLDPPPVKALHTPNTSDLDALERAESTPNLTSSPETLMGPRFSLRRTSGRRPLSILSSSSMNSDLSHGLDPLLESLPLKSSQSNLDPTDAPPRPVQASRHQRHRSMLGSSLDRFTPNHFPQGAPSQHSTPGHYDVAFDPTNEYVSSLSGPNAPPGANCHLSGPQYIYRDQYANYAISPAEFYGGDPYSVSLEERRSSTCLTPFLEPFSHHTDAEPSSDNGNFIHRHPVGNGSPYYSRPPQQALRTRSCPDGLPSLDLNPFFTGFADPKFASPVSPLCTLGKNSYEQIEAVNETMQDMLVRLAAKERQVLEAKQRWESLCGELEVYRQHCNTNLVPGTGRIILPIKPSVIARRHHPNIGLYSLHYIAAVRKPWHLDPTPSLDARDRLCVNAKFNYAFNVHARRHPLSVRERPQVLVWKIDSEVPAPSQPGNMDIWEGFAATKAALVHQHRGIAYYIVKCLLGVVHCVITTLPVYQREFNSQTDSYQLDPQYPMPMEMLFGHIGSNSEQ